MTTVHAFDGLTDGGAPLSLIQATDGNFYGTTEFGGDLTCNSPHGCGVLFELSPAGGLTVLHSFEMTDGFVPGGLLQDTNGIIYGTAELGGLSPYLGTIFSLDMGLNPFVAFIRSYGKIGQTGGILGQGFTGTTAVSFNGIAANFMVKADTFLEATLPSGATTGYVTVTTPTGVLTSNVPFHVIQ